MNKANFYIYVNGKEFIVEKNTTLIKLIKDLNLEKKSFAIAVNSEVVKKENYNRFIILPDSKIEIISAVGGG
ncbi:MAG: sulfur carrier protein ThiS [Chloroflexota bacterium]|jgi:sulfur carrier protein|nr:sulfur carrier protein ThiS [Chloroflexota bacterium]MEE2620309.1 sulfur carrier protein ThiS [Chloroflexota bacterium]|tara:strand:+ start:746 stop:961 length:216 start_codon:yes stop_codon:yes gene_type:complete